MMPQNHPDEHLMLDRTRRGRRNRRPSGGDLLVVLAVLLLLALTSYCVFL